MTDLLRPFTGLWHLSKDIFDLDSQWKGQFEGQAIFVRDAGGMSYTETGDLMFAGLQSSRSTQRYRWVQVEDVVEVRHADDQPFHWFAPTDGPVETEHMINGDFYAIRYMFQPDGTWRTEWRVEGPAKDYRLVCRFQRIRP